MTFNLPALQNEFVNWDDGLYVYENFNIRSIDLHVLKWVFTLGTSPTEHPLTLLALVLDYAIWGLNPLGYHLTNNILHVINTSPVFILSINLTGYANPVVGKKDYCPFLVGAITALLFGIHPLNPLHGAMLTRLGKYQPAITDYNEAIELNSGFTGGNAYAALGNLEQAIKDYGKAIDIDPKNADAYYNLENIYANLKDYQRAILNFNVAVKLNPKYTEAYNNRGMAYDNIENHKRAI